MLPIVECHGKSLIGSINFIDNRKGYFIHNLREFTFSPVPLGATIGHNYKNRIDFTEEIKSAWLTVKQFVKVRGMRLYSYFKKENYPS